MNAYTQCMANIAAFETDNSLCFDSTDKEPPAGTSVDRVPTNNVARCPICDENLAINPLVETELDFYRYEYIF